MATSEKPYETLLSEILVTVRRFSQLLSLALPLLGLLATVSSPARAQGAHTATPAVIAIMPFDGKEAQTPPKKPLQVMPTASAIGDVLMTRAQAAYYRVLPADLFGGIARIKYRGRAPDLRAMSRLLKANILLGGWVEATPGPDAPRPYRLTLSLYDAEGQSIGQLGYDVDSPTLNAQKFIGQATAFFQMLDGALHIPGTAAPGQAVAQTQTPAQAPSQWSGQAQGQAQMPQGQGQAQGQWSGQAATPDQTLPRYDGAASVTPENPPPVVHRPRSRKSHGPVAQAEDSEEAPLGQGDQPLVPRDKAASDLYDRRPPWQSAFDIRIGYLYNSRALTNEGSPLGFPRSGASGLAINLELHPLSFVKTITSPVAGIGLRLSALLPFWGTVSQVNDGNTTGTYKSGERRIEFALRWHWNFWDEVLRPEFEVEGLFGDHAFEFSQPVNILYLHLPPSDYRYLGMLFGLRMHFTRWLSGRFAFSAAKILSLGLMTTPGVDSAGNSLRDTNGFQSYGPGTGNLWRTDLGLTADVWRGILVGAAFYFERNNLSFDGLGNIQKMDGTAVTSARDEYIGFMLTVGYYFRPLIR